MIQSDFKFLSENEILTELKRLLRESTKMNDERGSYWCIFKWRC